MQLISAQDGRLVRLQEWESAGGGARGGRTGIRALDALLPPGGFKAGAIHELLHRPEHPQPYRIAAMLAGKAACCEVRVASTDRRDTTLRLADDFSALATRDPQRATIPQSEIGDREPQTINLIWFDPDHTFFPPALLEMGFDLSRLYIVHPPTYADRLWALAECLRCPAVGAAVCAVDRLTRVEARKLQLAAEQGGGIGVLLRPLNKNADTYAAATRWLVEPAPGERSLQRWKLQLIHGHGGRIGSVVYLEHCRETHLLRATDQLVHRPREAEAVA